MYPYADVWTLRQAWEHLLETFSKGKRELQMHRKDLLTARISQALHPNGQGNIFVRNEPFEAIGS